MDNQNQNQDQDQNKEQPADGSNQKEGIIIAGPTKKCPYCGEELPEKIAFCLYCMKTLISNTDQNTPHYTHQNAQQNAEQHTPHYTQYNTGQTTEERPQGNKESIFKKKSVKILIGAAALFTVLALMAATAIVTAFIVSRQAIPNHNRQDRIFVPIQQETSGNFNQGTQQGGNNQQNVGNNRNGGNNRQQENNHWNDEGNNQQENSLQDSDSQGSAGMFDHVIPRSPERRGGPENPPISAIRAVELAHDYLLSIGVTDARFEYVYMDRERGVWVWSVEFEERDRDFEFYVDVETGEFLKAPRR